MSIKLSPNWCGSMWMGFALCALVNACMTSCMFGLDIRVRVKAPGDMHHCHYASKTFLKKKGKLHFTTLNYTPDCILHPKFFEWTFCSLNYDICYTFHPNIKFRVTMDGMLNHMTPTWLLLKCHQVKRPKCPLPSPKTQKTLHRFLVSILPSHTRFGVLGLSMYRSTQICRDKR